MRSSLGALLLGFVIPCILMGCWVTTTELVTSSLYVPPLKFLGAGALCMVSYVLLFRQAKEHKAGRATIAILAAGTAMCAFLLYLGPILELLDFPDPWRSDGGSIRTFLWLSLFVLVPSGVLLYKMMGEQPKKQIFCIFAVTVVLILCLAGGLQWTYALRNVEEANTIATALWLWVYMLLPLVYYRLGGGHVPVVSDPSDVIRVVKRTANVYRVCFVVPVTYFLWHWGGLMFITRVSDPLMDAAMKTARSLVLMGAVFCFRPRIVNCRLVAAHAAGCAAMVLFISGKVLFWSSPLRVIGMSAVPFAGYVYVVRSWSLCRQLDADGVAWPRSRHGTAILVGITLLLGMAGAFVVLEIGNCLRL